MKSRYIHKKEILKFKDYLYEEEKSEATISKYMHDVKCFYSFLPENKKVDKVALLEYKAYLSKNYKITSANSMLVALNSMLKFMNLTSLKLKLFKIQKSVFCHESKMLTNKEYKKLLKVAKSKKKYRLYMLLQTICGTGIRVSEHRFITYEAIEEGKAIIHNKGKVRTIFIPDDLRKILLKYCDAMNIERGSIFITSSGKPMDRSNIWTAMKELCKEADVSTKKVFPHNLRHLFALTYYRLQKDVLRLADILGHSSVDTTRIYTMSDGSDCQKVLSRMNLVELLQ